MMVDKPFAVRWGVSPPRLSSGRCGSASRQVFGGRRPIMRFALRLEPLLRPDTPRKWLVATLVLVMGSVAIGAMVAAVAVAVLPDRYTATVIVGRASAPIANGIGATAAERNLRGWETLVRSDAVVREAASDPRVLGLRGAKRMAEGIAIAPVVRGDKLSQDRIAIRYTSEGAGSAARGAHIWADAFIALREKVAGKARRDRLTELDGRIAALEKGGVSTVQSNKENMGEVEATAMSSDAAEDNPHDALAEAEDALAQARADRIAAESALSSGVQLAGAQAAISSLRSDLAEAQARKASLETNFSADYPEVKDTKAKIARIEAAIADIRTNGQSGLAADLAFAKEAETAAEANLERVSARISEETSSEPILAASPDEILRTQLIQTRNKLAESAVRSDVAVIAPAKAPQSADQRWPAVFAIASIAAAVIIFLAACVLRRGLK